MGSGMDTGARGLRWWQAGHQGETSPQGTPTGALSGVGIVDPPQWGRNRRVLLLQDMALLRQEAEKSTSSAREPSLSRTPGQNRALLLLSHQQRDKESNSRALCCTPRRQLPAPSPHDSPPLCRGTVTVTHSSPGSSLWRKWQGVHRRNSTWTDLRQVLVSRKEKQRDWNYDGWQQSRSPGCLVSSMQKGQ